MIPKPFYGQADLTDGPLVGTFDEVNKLIPFLTRSTASRLGVDDKHVINLFDHFGSYWWNRPDLDGDGWHPNEFGYFKIAQLLYKAIMKNEFNVTDAPMKHKLMVPERKQD